MSASHATWTASRSRTREKKQSQLRAKHRGLNLTFKIRSGHAVERAEIHALTRKEMPGATFTISNLGMYDVNLFAPVINPPGTPILGVGRITLKPAVLGESVTARQMMTLTLVFDHRVIDGVFAAEFLQEVKQPLEAPEKLAA